MTYVTLMIDSPENQCQFLACLSCKTGTEAQCFLEHCSIPSWNPAWNV